MVALYAALAILGAAIPFAAILPWLHGAGLDVPGFVSALFVNPVSSFFGLDVVLSAVTLTIFIVVQGRRDDVKHGWLAVVATFSIGVSCGLPLFLALREWQLSRKRSRR